MSFVNILDLEELKSLEAELSEYLKLEKVMCLSGSQKKRILKIIKKINFIKGF